MAPAPGACVIARYIFIPIPRMRQHATTICYRTASHRVHTIPLTLHDMFCADPGPCDGPTAEPQGGAPAVVLAGPLSSTPGPCVPAPAPLAVAAPTYPPAASVGWRAPGFCISGTRSLALFLAGAPLDAARRR